MPIYDFICLQCGHRFDALTRHDWRGDGVSCPQCGSRDLEREVSRIGGFQSGGKMQTLSSGSSCSCCSGSTCSTCH